MTSNTFGLPEIKGQSKRQRRIHLNLSFEATDDRKPEESWGNRACNCVGDDNKTIYILTRLSMFWILCVRGDGHRNPFDIMQFSDRYEELGGRSAPVAFARLSDDCVR